MPTKDPDKRRAAGRARSARWRERQREERATVAELRTAVLALLPHEILTRAERRIANQARVPHEAVQALLAERRRQGLDPMQVRPADYERRGYDPREVMRTHWKPWYSLACKRWWT